MSTKKLLRGHRGRKARRFLKRHPESYIIAHVPTPQGKLGMLVFGPATFNTSLVDGVGRPPEDDPLIKAEDKPSCKTCGATGDNPCVTASGKRANKPHAGRDML